MTTTTAPSDFGDYLISARSFDEYLAMFALAESDIRGTILDCPGGGSSFTALASAAGADVTAADPAYAAEAEQLGELVVAETQRGSAWAAAGGDRYLWDYYGDVEQHQRIRQAAALVFARDLKARPERYVSAALPSLPFQDRQFDLVLSSHFLFTYTDRLDAGFHLRAMVEMDRTSRGEVRIFPLLSNAGTPNDELLETLRTQLASRGIDSEVRRTDYEFQRGGNQFLVLSSTSTTTADDS